MRHVIFVAPYLLPTTIRFVEAVSNVKGAKLSLITKDPPNLLPKSVLSKFTGYGQVQHGLQVEELTQTCRQLIQKHGPCHRLFGALEDLQVPLAKVRENLRIPGMDSNEATGFRDKNVMKARLAHAGLPVAKHRLVKDESQVWAFLGEVGFPVIAKPPDGAGAKATYNLKSESDVNQFLIECVPSAMRPVLLEEFVQGEEHSFDCVCIQGKPVWHSISRYYPTPLEVLQNPWIQWCVFLPRDISGSEYDLIRQQGTQSLKVLGMGTGLAHMEWFRTKSGRVAISEVGARPPGAQFTTLHSYAHDFDLYRAWAHLMVHDEFHPPKRNWAVGAAYLRGMGSGRIKAVHGLDEAQKRVGDLVIEARLPQIGASPSSSYEGDGYVILKHKSDDVVKKALSILISTIRIEVSHR